MATPVSPSCVLESRLTDSVCDMLTWGKAVWWLLYAVANKMVVFQVLSCLESLQVIITSINVYYNGEI